MMATEGRVVAGDGRATMTINGSARAEIALDEIERLLVLRHADAVFHGEEPFYVIFCPQDLWVIPETTTGLPRFLAEIGPALAVQGRLADGTCAAIPWSWRRRILGMIPAFPVPRLSCHDRASCPDLEDVRTIGLAELPDLQLETER